jgi:hypothetical protein
MFSIVTIIFSFKFINYFINNISHIVINPNVTCARLVCPPHWHSAQAPRVRLVCLAYRQAGSQSTQGWADRAPGGGNGLPNSQTW